MGHFLVVKNASHRSISTAPQHDRKRRILRPEIFPNSHLDFVAQNFGRFGARARLCGVSDRVCCLHFKML